jgi:three-Cys-motif partner protein
VSQNVTESEVGPWAADKLDRLRNYLNAYTTIMKEQSYWCKGFYYIDACAGPGQHVVRSARSSSPKNQQALLDVACFAQQEPEQQAFVAGSPQVALDLVHPFTSYVFIDKNASRIADLQTLQEEYKGRRKIAIRRADCNGYLRDKVVNNPQIDWNTRRALVFLDPFGMQVTWKTLEMLGSTKAIEVFLNFPVGMAIQRLLPRDSDKLTDPRRAMLDEYFGSPDSPFFHVSLYVRRFLCALRFSAF